MLGLRLLILRNVEADRDEGRVQHQPGAEQDDDRRQRFSPQRISNTES